MRRIFFRLRPRARLLVWSLVIDYLVLSVGTTAVEEGWGLFEGFYYGMAALTTVGFGDLVPRTDGGRLLALVLVPAGIALGFGAGFVMLQDALRLLLNRKEMAMVRGDLVNHTIVCGYGKIGKIVVGTLRNLQMPVCVVDVDPEEGPRLESAGMDYVIGDAMDTEVLREAGVSRAGCVVTTFDNDAHNVYVVLEVRDSRPDVNIIATASSADAGRRLRLAGAHRVISPAALAGEMLAKSAINPNVIDLMTDVTDVSAGEASFGQIAVQEGSWIAGRTLADIGRIAPGALVMLVKEGGRVQLAPGGSLLVKPGMILVVVGKADAVKALSAMESP